MSVTFCNVDDNTDGILFCVSLKCSVGSYSRLFGKAREKCRAAAGKSKYNINAIEVTESWGTKIADFRPNDCLDRLIICFLSY
jgi:hypothetical protein